MYTQKQFSIHCNDKKHNKEECTFICLNQNCKEFRLCCIECLRNNMHQTHMNNLEPIKKLDIQILEWQNKTNNLLNYLDDQIKQLQLQYQNLKLEIVKKYYLPFPLLVNMTNTQLNEAISNLLDFQSYEKTILDYLKQTCESHSKEIILLSDELQIDKLSYKELSEKQVSQSNQLFEQGIKSYYQNDFKSAIISFEQSFLYNPSSVETKNKLKESQQLQLKSHIQSNQLQSTLQSEIINVICQPLSQPLPQPPKIQFTEFFNQGESLKKNNKYTEAIQMYDKVFQIEQNHIPSLQGKGQCLIQLNQHKEALEIFNKILQIDTNNALCFEGKGECLRLLGSHKEAIICFDKALSLDSSLLNSYKGRGDCLRQMDRYMDAILDYEKIIQVNFSSVPALWGKGDCLRMMGKFIESLEYYERALSFDCKHVLSLTSKGESLRSLKRMQEAIFCYDQALLLEPNNIFTLQCKGQFLIQVQQYRDAEIQFQKCLILKPNTQFYINQIQFCQEKQRIGAFGYY